MCEKCIEIDKKIQHYREIASRLFDEQTIDGIGRLIAELEQRKLTFGCEAK